MTAPKICDGQKIAQNFSRFLTKTDFDREYLRNGSTYQKSEKLLIIYHPSQIKLVYFGSQTKKLLTLIYLHPNCLFSRDYISALRGCCALKFLHTLEIDHGLLALTGRGTGVSPPKKNRENLKF